MKRERAQYRSFGWKLIKWGMNQTCKEKQELERKPKESHP